MVRLNKKGDEERNMAMTNGVMELSQGAKEACVKVLTDADFNMSFNLLANWFEKEGGWIFKGENLESLNVKDDGENLQSEDNGDRILKLAKVFTSSIDEALKEAYCTDSCRSLIACDNGKVKDAEKNQRIIWAVKCPDLINNVKEQFKAKATDNDLAFCKEQKEKSIVQGNRHNVLLPRGVVPVPLYDSEDNEISLRRWILVPYTPYSFLENLAAALNINKFKLGNCLEENTLSYRESLQTHAFINHAAQSSYVVVKIVFVKEMRQAVFEYLNRGQS